MKQTIITMLTIIVIIVLLSSCSSGGRSRPQEEFRYGTEGLDINFYEDIFIDPVKEGSRLIVPLEIVNEGAYDVENGVLSLAVDESYVRLISNDKKGFQLRGKSPQIPDGESESLSFQTEVGFLEPNSRRQENVLYATVCYDYKTILTTDVCIDTDPYSKRQSPDKKVCSRSSVSAGSQGSPIVITKVDVKTYLENDEIYLPEFVFHIANRRQGMAFAYDAVATICSSNDIPDDVLGKISLYAKLSETVLACDKPEFNLNNGEATVTCGFEPGYGIDPLLDAYVAPLYVELNYGYTETIAKRFVIER